MCYMTIYHHGHIHTVHTLTPKLGCHTPCVTQQSTTTDTYIQSIHWHPSWGVTPCVTRQSTTTDTYIQSIHWHPSWGVTPYILHYNLPSRTHTYSPYIDTQVGVSHTMCYTTIYHHGHIHTVHTLTFLWQIFKHFSLIFIQLVCLQIVSLTWYSSLCLGLSTGKNRFPISTILVCVFLTFHIFIPVDLSYF